MRTTLTQTPVRPRGARPTIGRPGGAAVYARPLRPTGRTSPLVRRRPGAAADTDERVAAPRVSGMCLPIAEDGSAGAAAPVPRPAGRAAAGVGSARPAGRRTTRPTGGHAPALPNSGPRRSRPAGAPRRAAVRLTRRGRLLVAAVLTLALTVVVLAAFVAGRSSVATAGSSEQPEPLAVVVVEPGDTLWSIARSAAPGEDPRAVIDRIGQASGVTSETLQAGDEVVVPAP